MSLLQKIALRFFALVILLVAMNFIYIAFFLESDLQKHSEIINDLRVIPENTEILYIGESSNNTAAAMDMDKRTISGFLTDYFPEMNVASITKPASHSGIYKTLLKNIEHAKSIKTVVVTLNLRSFNAEWVNSGLETPLQKSMVLLQDYPPLFNRFMLSFKGYPIKTERERSIIIHEAWENEKLTTPHDFPFESSLAWRNHFEQVGLKNASGEYDTIRSLLARDYASTYAFQIDLDNHPRIADFNEIIELAKRKNWNLVFNLLAENTEKAEGLCSKDLVFFMRENRDKLVKYFSKKGVKVVDNLEILDNAQFIDQEWPTEHYFEQGRKTIAANVAKAIRNFHTEAFSPVEYYAEPKYHFHNDCEGDDVWMLMSSRTREEAYSGEYSSRTDQDNIYSLNFTYPYDKIPDDKKTEVTVSMMLKGPVHDDAASFIVDISGGEKERFWSGVSLKPLSRGTEGWQRVSHTFFLGEAANGGELISIYLLNNTGNPIYADDIDIQFK